MLASRVNDSRRHAVTLLELLAVVAAVVILMALMVPALSRARDTSRRSACQSNLHNIGKALLLYDTTFGFLPAGRDALEGRNHSWATRLLPYLGHTDLYVRYDFTRPWNEISAGVENGRVAETSIPVFQCPATVHHQTGGGDYGGNYGSSLSGLRKGFGMGRAWDAGVLLAIHAPARKEPRTRLITRDMISDGQGQTFAVLEDAGRGAQQGGQWADGHQCLAHEDATVNVDRRQGIFSDHLSGANALMADGSVAFFTTSTTAYVLGAYSTRAHEELIKDPVTPGT